MFRNPKFTLLTPKTLLPAHGDFAEDLIAEQFVVRLTHQMEELCSQTVHVPTAKGEAHLDNGFDDFEEHYLSVCDHLLVAMSSWNKACLEHVYPRLLVFLTTRPQWMSRIFFVFLGPRNSLTDDYEWDFISHEPIYFDMRFVSLQAEDSAWHNFFASFDEADGKRYKRDQMRLDASESSVLDGHRSSDSVEHFSRYDVDPIAPDTAAATLKYESGSYNREWTNHKPDRGHNINEKSACPIQKISDEPHQSLSLNYAASSYKEAPTCEMCMSGKQSRLNCINCSHPQLIEEEDAATTYSKSTANTPQVPRHKVSESPTIMVTSKSSEMLAAPKKKHSITRTLRKFIPSGRKKSIQHNEQDDSSSPPWLLISPSPSNLHVALQERIELEPLLSVAMRLVLPDRFYARITKVPYTVHFKSLVRDAPLIYLHCEKLMIPVEVVKHEGDVYIPKYLAGLEDETGNCSFSGLDLDTIIEKTESLYDLSVCTNRSFPEESSSSKQTTRHSSPMSANHWGSDVDRNSMSSPESFVERQPHHSPKHLTSLNSPNHGDLVSNTGMHNEDSGMFESFSPDSVVANETEHSLSVAYPPEHLLLDVDGDEEQLNSRARDLSLSPVYREEVPTTPNLGWHTSRKDKHLLVTRNRVRANSFRCEYENSEQFGRLMTRSMGSRSCASEVRLFNIYPCLREKFLSPSQNIEAK
ncbi:hypothetical protein Ciccas_000972 [Cichlidogyrus casuarinus]|uniref:Uncharacterized protein n=1 Tax=Cichlidogyrus casuarinus TaxID=1844966 RepID=A0ABD2QMH0_9PLAT